MDINLDDWAVIRSGVQPLPTKEMKALFEDRTLTSSGAGSSDLILAKELESQLGGFSASQRALHYIQPNFLNAYIDSTEVLLESITGDERFSDEVKMLAGSIFAGDVQRSTIAILNKIPRKAMQYPSLKKLMADVSKRCVYYNVNNIMVGSDGAFILPENIGKATPKFCEYLKTVITTHRDCSKTGAFYIVNPPENLFELTPSLNYYFSEGFDVGEEQIRVLVFK